MGKRKKRSLLKGRRSLLMVNGINGGECCNLCLKAEASEKVAGRWKRLRSTEDQRWISAS